MEPHTPATAASRLEDVLITHELRCRPARKKFAAENRALLALAKELAEAPDHVQSKLTEVILELCQADSAGVSLLEAGPPEVFRWTAVTGGFAQHLGGSIPRHASPCEVVIERNEVLLFRDSELYFPLLRIIRPAVYESLLAPFDVEGRPGGAVWAVKHRPEGRFDAEDARLLKSISAFAAATYQAAQARARAERVRDTTATLHPRLLQVSKMAMIGEIASGVANELSQPLTAIGHYAQACKRLLSGPQGEVESLIGALDEINAQAQRAAETIGGLRRLAATGAPEALESNLNEAVEEVLELLRVNAQARNVRVGLRLATHLPPVKIERTEIQHVVLNLLSNALDVLVNNPRDSREVVIETQMTSDGAALTVSDNGPGLPENVRERMFAPFYSTKASGTGLGLPISHSIIRAHGGRLTYEQNAAGGACFRISLPVSPDPQSFQPSQ